MEWDRSEDDNSNDMAWRQSGFLGGRLVTSVDDLLRTLTESGTLDPLPVLARIAPGPRAMYQRQYRRQGHGRSTL